MQPNKEQVTGANTVSRDHIRYGDDSTVTLGLWILKCENNEPNNQGRFSLSRFPEVHTPVLFFSATLDHAIDILCAYHERDVERDAAIKGAK